MKKSEMKFRFNLIKGLIAGLMVFSFVLFICLFANPTQTFAKDGDGDIVVIIDPGHGGYDGGAMSLNGDTEASINWDIVKYMKAELETYNGVKVYITRASNEWNSNTGRSQLGQKLGADVIISVHNNASSSASTSGFTAYGSVAEGYVEVTKNLCLNLARHAAGAGLDLFSGGYLTRSGTVDSAQDYYTVIDEGIKLGIPTVIVEHCFLSNASNSAFIHELSNRKKVGAADAQAVAEFYGLSKRTVSDGQSIALDRSYSAYFVPAVIKNEESVSFSTSDSNIAAVRSDGLITAVSPGTATITYTYGDGTSGTCTFTTKEVRQVGVAAGINPTVYHDSDSVAAIDKSRIMVKAIYSDGTVRQQSSGYTIGNIDPSIVGRQYITVEHNGFTNTFSITLDPEMEAGSYSSYLYQTSGEYSDIFTLPELIDAGTASGEIVSNPGFSTVIVNSDNPISETTAAPEETTVAETTTAETTTMETTVEETTAEMLQPETTEAVTEEENSETETTETEALESTTGEVPETESTSMETVEEEAVQSGGGISMDWFFIVLVLLLALLIAAIVMASLSIAKNNRAGKINEADTEEENTGEPRRKKRK